jgi:small-conductance mechanosensitive channel
MSFRHLLGAFVFAAGAGLAQQPDAMPPPADIAKNLETLRSLAPALVTAEDDLAALRADLETADTENAKADRAERIDAQRERVRQLRENFRIISSGVEDKAYLSEAEEAASPDGQIKDLLKPLLESLREATAKPREMAELRSELSVWQEREALARAALDRVTATLAAAEEERILEELESARKLWSNRLDEALSQTGTLSRQIEERERNTPGAWEFVSRGISNFWKSRGLNLLLALAISLTVYFAVRRGYRLIRRFTPLHRSKGEEGLMARSADLAVIATAGLLSFSAALLVIYLRGDWLILTLMIVLLIGLLWASKQALPPFIDEIRVILNLGSVRQGERLVYEGISWKVDRLHFFCEFSNPQLAGGILRLPVRDVMPLHSRPVVEKESWFPTQKDDWVKLADGTYGKIIQQTPEVVVVLRLGGSLKTYATAEFIEQNPENLTHGFRISVSFGVDYQLQGIATREVPEILQRALEPKLVEVVGREQLRSVKVEFASASPSSLDYAILADFSGEVASRANVLERLIQRVCVEACNEQGWVIPFTQVTVHQA